MTTIVFSSVVAAELPVRTPIFVKNLTLQEKRVACGQIECELHNCRFELFEVPISYGSRNARIDDEIAFAYRRKLARVSGRYFPNAPPKTIHVGMDLGEEKETDLDCACPACLMAREKWDECCSEALFRECSDPGVQKTLAATEQLANVSEEFGDKDEAFRLRKAVSDFRAQCEDLWRHLAEFEGVEGCDQHLTPHSSGPPPAAGVVR